MNLVGKIFVGIIFVMSIMFATFAMMVYATHRNWREEVMGAKGWKARYNQKTEEAAKLQTERKEMELKLTSETTAKNQALAKAESEIQRLMSDEATARNNFDKA